MAKRPSTPVEDEQPVATEGRRDLPARRTPGDGHLPGDDRPAPGGPREERQRAQCRGRRGRTHRARHPAPGRAGGHRRSLRAVHGRHAGQDRPGRPAPGRHRPGDRPGPVAPAPARLHPDRPVPAGRRSRSCPTRRPRGPRDPGAHAHRPGPDRAVRRQRRARAAGGRRRRPQHHRARAARRHGRVQPGHVHRAAPGAARDHRRRRAPQARLGLPRPPGRDPRAEGQDPVRGQVRDGQDPARVHPARAAEGHPARARRGRPAAGRDQRAARQGRGRRHAGGDQGPGDQGSRPDEPDPVRLARGRGHPDVRGLARSACRGTSSTDDQLDIKEAARILDEDHYGLEKIKERILEYLAVRTLADEIRSPILAFVGPPGVGKTSPGQEHRQGHGPQVRPDEPRRHPRRGRDPRPPPHLHRRAPGPHHPEHQDRGFEQPGVHARRGRQDRHGLPGRPVAPRCSRSSTRSRTTPSRTTTSRCRST